MTLPAKFIRMLDRIDDLSGIDSFRERHPTSDRILYLTVDVLNGSIFKDFIIPGLALDIVAGIALGQWSIDLLSNQGVSLISSNGMNSL